jgi:hypothetical protein
MHRADKVETHVWDMISELLKDPQQLRADLDRMIELERSSMPGDPDREQKAVEQGSGGGPQVRSVSRNGRRRPHHLRGVES